ncbi:nitrite reductase small subunit NirD [Streptomyces sp. NPDC050504]|uniref:nitrite reductase small subunit NirD n=1 Tax=Streptomyces sp. NPDC050504 TaxID=3365618 RepID=UPI00378ED68E
MTTTAPAALRTEEAPTAPAPAAVEIHDGTRWERVCALEDLVPGRGVAVLVGAEQIAVFRDRADRLYALANRDPFSGAHVLSRGLTGSRGGVPVVASPMYKQAFDLRTGVCLDDEECPPLRVWPVRAAGTPLTSRPATAGVRET